MNRPGAAARRLATTLTIAALVAGCSTSTSATGSPAPDASGGPIAIGSGTPSAADTLGASFAPPSGATGSAAPGSSQEASQAPGASGTPGAPASTSPSVKPSAKPTTSPTTAGPAVKFSVQGLVYQQRICYTLTVCTQWPPADYPRQLVKVTALDAQGHVATGYTGTVTFTNPAFPPGNGGLADSKLTKGVGIFPVLEPKLTFKAQGEPWDSLCGSGGIALHVHDTLDPSIAGCENIPAGGAITLVHPEVYTDVTPSGCSTGCLQEPTNTIVIDQSFLNPTIEKTTTSEIYITGETLQQQFYVQPVTIGVITVAVGDTSNLTLCGQCNDGTQLFLQRSQVPLTVGSSLLYTNSLTPSNPATETTWTGFDSLHCIGGSDYCFAIQQAQIYLNTALPPTCYETTTLETQAACIGG